jgi:hypothetical protein
MSEFLEAIEARATGNVFALPKRFPQLSVSVSRDIIPEYEFRVLWRVVCPVVPERIEELKFGVMQELAEAIYGDIRLQIIQVERDSYSGDSDKLKTSIKSLKKMVGLERSNTG